MIVAELDAQVPDEILRHMPALADGAFDDPRTTLVIGDARDLVDAALASGEHFDAIVFDLTEADAMRRRCTMSHSSRKSATCSAHAGRRPATG